MNHLHLTYQGIWDAWRNEPELPPAPDREGDYYKVSAPSPDGTYDVGDCLVAMNGEWVHVPSRDIQ